MTRDRRLRRVARRRIASHARDATDPTRTRRRRFFAPNSAFRGVAVDLDVFRIPRRRMPQGALKSREKLASGRRATPGKKAGALAAANRHGKIIKQRKGKFIKAPKASSALVNAHAASSSITREVNAKNELEFSRKATASGGTFRLLQRPEGVELDKKLTGPKPKKAKPVVKTPLTLQKEKDAAKWSY
jgi:hypothetical protein